MNTIEVKSNEIVEEFQLFDEWMDKYQHIIDMGNEISGLDEQHKTEENLVRGCQSRVWLRAWMQEDLLFFQADSDAIITKGIVAMLVRVLSGQKPMDVIHADLEFIKTIGLYQHLSPTRSNGLVSMIKKIKSYALAYESKKAQ